MFGRTGIIYSLSPAKKPLLASNSSPHHLKKKDAIADALKMEGSRSSFHHTDLNEDGPIKFLLGVDWPHFVFQTVDTEMEMCAVKVL